MTESRRIGIIVMVASVVLAIMIVFLSDGACRIGSAADNMLFGWIMYCSKLKLFFVEDFGYILDMPTKYPILFCVVLFAGGLLSYLGVLNQNKNT